MFRYFVNWAEEDDADLMMGMYAPAPTCMRASNLAGTAYALRKPIGQFKHLSTGLAEMHRMREVNAWSNAPSRSKRSQVAAVPQRICGGEKCRAARSFRGWLDQPHNGRRIESAGSVVNDLEAAKEKASSYNACESGVKQDTGKSIKYPGG